MCMSIFVCVYVFVHVYAVPIKARKSVRSPWTRIADGYELTCGCWGLNLDPLIYVKALYGLLHLSSPEDPPLRQPEEVVDCPDSPQSTRG